MTGLSLTGNALIALQGDLFYLINIDTIGTCIQTSRPYFGSFIVTNNVNPDGSISLWYQNNNFNQWEFAGGINIHQLKVRLTDRLGNTIDLPNSDWIFGMRFTY